MTDTFFYILTDGQIPSFSSERILYHQEYIQPVVDLVVPCNTFRMLVQIKSSIED